MMGMAIWALLCIYHLELLQGRTERIEDGGDVSSNKHTNWNANVPPGRLSTSLPFEAFVLSMTSMSKS